MQGDLQQARLLLTEASAGFREQGDRGGLAKALCSLALLFHDEGDVVRAGAHVSEALAIQQAVGEQIMLSFSLEVAASVASAFTGPIGVAHLLGAAQRLGEEFRNPIDFDLRERHERLVAANRSAFGDEVAFDLAWNEGRSMTNDDSVRLALALLK